MAVIRKMYSSFNRYFPKNKGSDNESDVSFSRRRRWDLLLLVISQNLVGYFIGYFITSLYYLLVETCRRDGDSGSESDVSPMRGRRPKSSVEPWYENQWNETMQG